MVVDDALISEVVKRILNVIQPKQIILFGSAAAGTMTPDSDIDLLILEESPVDLRAARLQIREALRGLGFPFDVIVMSIERFEETRDIIGGIAHPASKYGKVIYEAA